MLGLSLVGGALSAHVFGGGFVALIIAAIVALLGLLPYMLPIVGVGLTLEAPVLTFQRVDLALSKFSTPASKAAFRDFKSWLLQQKNLTRLQFVAIDGNYSASDGGNNASQVLADAALTLYALYLKKNTGATAVWFKGSNHASTATTDGTQVLSEHSAAASDEIMRFWPNGKALATGLTVTENTTATGSTLTLTANRLDGFVVIGG